jgi:DNA polymerase-3 subunit gamma/tau
MSYLVIARKYRPKNFDEIVGQEHISQTLMNAVNDNRIAHAYLFSGPRGVGKTTMARILSKSINCEKGPTSSPCNKCSNCKEIDDSMNLDVLEIDGASNRGINEIRTLQENTKYSPGHGKYKIYIIDEVHMLTKEAFNALLKTLEEPPKHVIFIFATTEPHKVPMTVLSRCQRFNFRRLTVNEIEKKLQWIAKKEKISIDETAIKLIARQADGSLRDGESMLDQLHTYSDEVITEKEVHHMFGFVEDEIYFTLTDAIKERDEKEILSIVDTLFDRGYDMEEFVSGYMKHLRRIFFLKNNVTISDLSPEETERYNAQKDLFSGFVLLQILNRLSFLIRRMKNSTITRVLLELELLILSRFEDTLQISELIQKLENGGGNPEKNRVKEEESHYKTETENNETPSKIETHDLSLDTIWEKVSEEIISKRRQLAGIKENFHPLSLDKGLLTIQIESHNGFIKNELEEKGGKELIEETFSAITGEKTRIKFTHSQTPSKRVEEKGKKKKTLKENTMIKKVKEILDAEIIEER